MGDLLLLAGPSLSIMSHATVLHCSPLNELFHAQPIPPAELLPIVPVPSLVLWAEEVRNLFARVRSHGLARVRDEWVAS